MNDQIREIVHSHCDKIKNELNTESIPKAIKSVDAIVQIMYTELYGLKDIRYQSPVKSPVTEKKGHCC
jgi:hypothetical protein